MLFFRTFDFLLFQIIFNQKEPLNFFLLLFQIIFNQKELFFKKGTIGKVWYIADRVDRGDRADMGDIFDPG